MKKLFSVFVFVFVFVAQASAFEFDGIDLNGSMLSITRNISLRGYAYDESAKCLKGYCQGKEIYMSFNYEDVNQKGKLGQLIVDVPMKQADALQVITEAFNITYHQIDPVNGKTTYLVDNDGTILIIEGTKMGVRFTYHTPFYKAPTSK